MSNYIQDRREGIIGEEITRKWLMDAGWDVMPYDAYRDRNLGIDIDATAYDEGLLCVSIDSKYDKYISSSRNFCFETISNMLTDKLGWGQGKDKQVEYICIVDAKADKATARIWICRIADMREFYWTHKDKWKKTDDKRYPFRLTYLKSYDKKTDELKQITECALFSIAEYSKEFCYAVVDEKRGVTYCGNMAKAWKFGEM